MKLEPQHIDYIRKQSSGLTSTKALARLLQWIYIKKFPQANRRINITARHLTHFAFHDKERYVTFEIPKKNGGSRTISAPVYVLKTIQKCLNEILNAMFTPHKAAMGFIPGKSVVDNARLHIGKRYVYNIDLSNFFPSVEFRRVKTMLELEPFGFSDEIAFLIANLCCEQGCLPQGAPTSPTLTNIVCQRLDRKLLALAKANQANYTRYADDITFSSYRSMYTQRLLICRKPFQRKVRAIIEDENFKLNEAKERLQGRNMRQEVTGLVVNEKVNVNRRYIKDVRYWLRTWAKFGAEETQLDFAKRYKNKKGYLRYNGAPRFENYLYGKILFLGMVRGQTDHLTVKFLNSFRNLEAGLVPISSQQAEGQHSLSQIFYIWLNEGIDAAIRKWRRSN